MYIGNYTLCAAPVRRFQAKVELFKGSTLAATYTGSDALVSATIERAGEDNKFFGYGICQKLILELLDKERVINIDGSNSFKCYFKVAEEDFINNFPQFFVEEPTRDENTNSLKITAYDALFAAAAHTVSELGLTAPYTIGDVAIACAALLGLNGYELQGGTVWETSYEDGANFNGDETIRSVLDAIAEATQTIYYIGFNNRLIFKRLDIAGEPVLTIDKDSYFKLTTNEAHTLTALCHATELGDNLLAGAQEGATQYIRDNPFWDLREDIATLLENALAAVNGLTIIPFSCEWRGNYFLDVGDKIALITKDDNSISSYLTTDTIKYNGGYSQNSSLNYTEDKAETATNPTTIGEAINKTYARVDKVSKEIELVASDINANSEAISSLQITTGNISASVKDVQTSVDNSIDAMEDKIQTLTKEVGLKVGADEVEITISNTLAEGVEKVKTTTKAYTFDDAGLNISSSDSEISTQITEDGMTIFKNTEAVLTADNGGVKAQDLHATSYLIIGNNSRFEDRGERTACYWIREGG